MRRYMIMLALALGLTAIAQSNRIYIEDFEIYPDSTITVPVMMANADPTRGFQFNMTLPDGLEVIDCKLTEYAADDYKMHLFSTCKAAIWTLGMYPVSRVCLPPDNKALMTIIFKAAADFRGGEIFLWKCRGSTMESGTIIFEDDTTTVTVPSSTLIGIPMDKGSDSDGYFNLMGEPIPLSDGVPADGNRDSRIKPKSH